MAEIPNAELIKILLVEANLGDARMVEIQLSRARSSANFEVVRAESPGEAIERLEHSRFDAILLDLSLPDSSGLELVSRLRTAAFQTPIVVLSGQADEETASQALQMGAQDYLIKGQTDSDLVVRSIRYAIERARTEEELRRTEEALRRSLKELANLKFALDESAIVAMADEKGMITYVNDMFCKVSGYSREEFMSQDRRIVDTYYHPETLVDDVWRTITRGEVWRGEIKHPARDGTHFWLDAAIVPFLDEHGAPERYVAICSDITQRKEAEETLRRSLRELANLKFALHDEELPDRDYRSAYTDRYLLPRSEDDPGWTVA